jgi:hypothetical protein
MKKVISLFILTILISASSHAFSNFKSNDFEQGKFLQPKNLNVKSFFKLFIQKYKKDSKINYITLSGDFPKNWVKSNDIDYLVSIMRSKQKCCGYMNIFSSTITNEEAEIGGFAIIFLNSYISKQQLI